MTHVPMTYVPIMFASKIWSLMVQKTFCLKILVGLNIPNEHDFVSILYIYQFDQQWAQSAWYVLW